MILSPMHRVLVASGGAEALEILRTSSIDLVTLDLNMPGMKGEEVMRTIREEFPYVEIIVITGHGTVETAAEGIRYGVCDYLTKPFDVVQVTAAVTRALTRQRGRRRVVEFLNELGGVLGCDRDVDEVVGELGDDHDLRDRLRGLMGLTALGSQQPRPELNEERTVAFLEVLAETIERRDPFMRGHARRVAFYSGLLADRLCLSAEEREHLRIASFLHDIGKIGVPTSVLLTAGELVPVERAVVEEHSAIGERLLAPLGFSGTIASVIRHHHERWNGTGYPDGLQGEQIPLAARIIAITDAFDAMTSDRPYRRALGREVAASELTRGAGHIFDPNLVKEFLALVESGAGPAELNWMANALAGERQDEPESAATPASEMGENG
ncbi:MAG: response regulator [Proteobacteria bacterium]|nr:response regulator [Pseudomonadota bacterium]